MIEQQLDVGIMYQPVMTVTVSWATELENNNKTFYK